MRKLRLFLAWSIIFLFGFGFIWGVAAFFVWLLVNDPLLEELWGTLCTLGLVIHFIIASAKSTVPFGHGPGCLPRYYRTKDGRTMKRQWFGDDTEVPR